MKQMVFCCKNLLLNMFRALLCPSSGAQEYYTDGCCLPLICLNKMPTRCNRGFLLQKFVCSTCFGDYYAHHQELKSIIQWLLPVVFGAVVFKLLVWCGAEGCVSGLQTNNLKTTAPNTTGSNHCIILLSS